MLFGRMRNNSNYCYNIKRQSSEKSKFILRWRTFVFQYYNNNLDYYTSFLREIMLYTTTFFVIYNHILCYIQPHSLLNTTTFFVIYNHILWWNPGEIMWCETLLDGQIPIEKLFRVLVDSVDTNRKFSSRLLLDSDTQKKFSSRLLVDSADTNRKFSSRLLVDSQIPIESFHLDS